MVSINESMVFAGKRIVGGGWSVLSAPNPQPDPTSNSQSAKAMLSVCLVQLHVLGMIVYVHLAPKN